MRTFLRLCYTRTVPSSSKQLLATLTRGSRAGIISVDRASDLLAVPREAAAARLSRLVRAGWLQRVKRGTYLILPLEAGPPVPTAIEDPWVLARELFSPAYIGGWSAAEHWGLTEQIFRSTFVVTVQRPRRRSQPWASVDYHVVHVPTSRIRGTVLVWRGREQVAVSGRERTIADALAAPKWVGGVRHLGQIMEAYRASREFNAQKLVGETARLGKGSALKRLGYLAETLWPDLPDLTRAARAPLPKGVIKLDPAVDARGRLNKRWGLWVNVTLTPSGVAPQ